VHIYALFFAVIMYNEAGVLCEGRE